MIDFYRSLIWAEVGLTDESLAQAGRVPLAITIDRVGAASYITRTE
jgi:hypothetical protein